VMITRVEGNTTRNKMQTRKRCVAPPVHPHYKEWKGTVRRNG